MKNTFKVLEVRSIDRASDGSYWAQVYAQGPRGMAVKELRFESKIEAENCKGMDFQV